MTVTGFRSFGGQMDIELDRDKYERMFAWLIEAATVRSKWRRLARPLRRAERAAGVAFSTQGQQFMRRFKTLQARVAEGRLAEAIAEDDWLTIWNTVTNETDTLWLDTLTDMMGRGLALGAAQAISDLQVDYAFQLSNPRAVAYIEQNGALRVAGINDTTQAAIRNIVTQGTREGWSYDRVAREINRQFREFAVGRPQEHIQSRGHLVAITEMGNAYEAGSAVVIDDLQAAGLEMEKKWLTVGDNRVSDGCKENGAEGWIPYSQAFQSGHARPLRFPGCRCTTLYRRRPG